MEQNGWVECEAAFESAWDGFVEAHPRGRFSYLAGFKKTIETVYGLEPNYWLYSRSGQILAVFPSFFHSGLIYGKRLVSQPFSEYGGLLFAPHLEAREKRALLDEFPSVIEKSRRKRRFGYVEFRCFSDAEGTETALFKKMSLFSYGVLRLHPGFNLWRKADRSARKNLKRAWTHGLTLKEGKEEAALREIFYPLYLKTLKRLGSPPHPLPYFLTLRKNLKDRMKLFLARLDDVYVSALLGWAVGKSVHITDIASDERYFFARANDFLHFELIQWAIANDFRCFDFGPVRYPGQRQYKKKWGVELLEYAYYYFPKDRFRKPFSDRSLPARLASSCWKTLVPRGLASRAGKYLRKELSL